FADQVEDAQRDVQNAKNGLLPDLNFTAGGRVGNSAGHSLTRFDTDTTTYDAGIRLDLPIDKLAERNTYRRSLIGLERAQRAYDQARDQIAADARDSLRLIL